MDITTFEVDYCESDGQAYTKIIGKYILNIFLGDKIWLYTKSKPLTPNLNYNEYEIVGVEIEEIGDGTNENNTVDLNKLGLKDYCFSKINCFDSNYYCYNLSVDIVEEIYNKLCELVKNESEKKCKQCGRMNDVDAEICWGFTCGASLE